MKINFSIIIVLISTIFILIVFWLALGKNTIYDTKNLTGKTIGNFNLKSINNKEESISEEYFEQNNYTLINIWASWCSPCREEHKFLMNLAKYKKDLKIIGINFKDKKNNAFEFLSELGNPYDFISEDKNGKLSVMFGIYGVPETILINKKKIVIEKFIGPLNVQNYNYILELIKKN